MTRTFYTAVVSGMAWAGYKATTSYDFSALPSRAEVLERASDFHDVLSISLTKTTTTVEKCHLV